MTPARAVRLRRLAAIAAVLAAGCSSGSSSTGASSPWDGLAPSGAVVDDVLGISSHIDTGPAPSATRDFELTKLAEAGIRRIRRDFYWSDIEPSDDDGHFEGTDTLVDLAASQGFALDALLVYGVGWAMPDGAPTSIPPAKYADFAGHVAAHYCGRIATYEIWNEPNLPWFFGPEYDPAAYGALLAAAYPAIQRACPGATVLFGGLNSAPYLEGRIYSFVAESARAVPAVSRSFDALAIHPYTFLQHAPPEWSAALGDARLPDLEGQVRVARERLAEAGNPSAPVVLTELGWPSWILSEEQQGAWTARALALAMKSGVEGYYAYTFFDGEGNASLPTEDHFGLFTYPGAAAGPREKPAFGAIRGVHRVIGSARYAGDLAAALALPDGVHGLAFVVGDGGARVLAAWDTRGPGGVDVEVPPPARARTYQVLDQTGEVLTDDRASGPVPVHLDERVTYVRFED